MFRAFLFPLLSAALARRSTSGRHSRLTSAGLALLAARLAGAGPIGLATVVLGLLVQGRGAARDSVDPDRSAGRRTR